MGELALRMGNGNSVQVLQKRSLILRRLNTVEYSAAVRAMRALTEARTEETADELWSLEHPAVFTLGQAGRREHVLSPGDIPVVKTDRGGQVTFHAPGQLVVYVLFDLKRASVGIKRVVQGIEQAMIEVLSGAGIEAVRRPGAPGVYVGGEKIGALGLRVRRGCSYHGLALNVDLDLEPFSRIDPCGIRGLEVTSLRRLGIDWTVSQAADRLLPALAAGLGYADAETVTAINGALPAAENLDRAAGLHPRHQDGGDPQEPCQ